MEGHGHCGDGADVFGCPVSRGIFSLAHLRDVGRWGWWWENDLAGPVTDNSTAIVIQAAHVGFVGKQFLEEIRLC